MSKMMLNKIRLVLVAVLVTMVIGMAGMFVTAKADVNYTSISDVTLAMDGADVIVEGEDGVNGLMFTVSMSVAEYEAMIGAEGSVNTGLIIAPAYYNDEVEINKDSLFGAEATYDWAEYVNNEWVYSGNKIRVININANDWVNAGDKYIYTGAIVDILPENETEVMMAIGYVNVGDEYNFSPIGKSSVVEAAFKADLDEAQKAWVDANWLDVLPIADEEVNLVSVAGKTEVNLLDCVSDEAKDVLGAFSDATVSAVDANGNVLDSAIVDVTNVNNLRAWTVEVKVGTTVVYTGVIDLYNMTSKLVWNTISEEGLNSFKGFYAGNEGSPVISLKSLEASVSSVGGKASIAVTDIENWAGKNPTSIFYTMMPVHSKGYYELYQGKDVTMYTGFYVEPKTDNYTGHAVDHLMFFGQGTISVPAINTWHGYDLPLDTIIENWDIIVNGNGSYSWGARDYQAMFYNLLNTCTPSEDMVYHFTGFELAMDVSALAAKGGEILVNLDNVADTTAVDLTSYMKKDDADMIKDVAAINSLTYEMSGYSITDAITVSDLTSVDMSEAKEAAYILNVKSGDSVIYNATIDWYSAQSPVVWADVLTTKNVLIHSGGYTTGRANPTTAKAFEIIDASTVTSETDPLYGKTGTYAKTVSTTSENVIVSVLSLHSKAYYKEMVANQNYVLTIDKYVAGSYHKTDNPGGSKLSGMGMQGTQNYGRWNTWSNYRGGDGGLNAWGEFPGVGLYMSLDNYLLRSEDDPCSFTGAWYDFYNVHSKAAKNYNMMQFEVQVASSADPVTIYISGAKIVEASETLLSASGLAGMTASSEYDKLTLEYDFANQTKVELSTVFDAINLAKYKVYVSKYGTHGNFKWKITFSDGAYVEIKPNAEGETLLDLEALADDGATVLSKLAANAKIKVVATSPSQPYPQPTNIAIFNATVKNLPITEA